MPITKKDKEPKTFDEFIESVFAGLSLEDRNWLVQHRGHTIVKELAAAIEQLQREIPALLVSSPTLKPISIPAVGKTVMVSGPQSGSYKAGEPPYHVTLGGKSDFELLYAEYPAQDVVQLIPKSLSKEVNWNGFLESLGDLAQLRLHAITPLQLERVTWHVMQYDPAKRYELLVFMEGYSHTKAQWFSDGPLPPCIHVLRICVGELDDRHAGNPFMRHLDWGFLGALFPLESADPSAPAFTWSSCRYENRTFEDSIILFKE